MTVSYVHIYSLPYILIKYLLDKFLVLFLLFNPSMYVFVVLR